MHPHTGGLLVAVDLGAAVVVDVDMAVAEAVSTCEEVMLGRLVAVAMLRIAVGPDLLLPFGVVVAWHCHQYIFSSLALAALHRGAVLAVLDRSISGCC